MAIKLHRCAFTFIHSDKDHCYPVQNALDEQNINYEVVKQPLLPRSRRKEAERLLASARQRGRGKASGAPMDAEATFVFTVREGLIARWQMFSSEEQALKAVGLAE